MSVELRPLGVKCNISCHYCYQDAVRKSGPAGTEYDLEAMKRATLARGGPFTLFGGEPLLMPKHDLEHLFAWGFQQFGSSAIQTNGVLLDEDHIRIFKQYKVSVGVSLDGPGECNRLRWAGSPQRTAESTAKSEANLARLLAHGVTPSLITTLHRANADAATLPRLLKWFRSLDRLGIPFARIHLLEVDSAAVGRHFALTAEENAAAMLALGELETSGLQKLRFDLFGEMEALLRGRDRAVSCVWRACDAYTTSAVQGIEGHGESSNCGRTNKAGIDFLKADRPGYERYLALHATEHRHGGCRGCRFFVFCKGQCPGTSLDGDWRNRTMHCEVWLRLFEHVERRLTAQGYVPLSLDPNLRVLESAMLARWQQGQNPALETVLAELRALAERRTTAAAQLTPA